MPVSEPGDGISAEEYVEKTRLKPQATAGNRSGAFFDRVANRCAQNPGQCLLVILFLGLVLRLIGIRSRGIWYDDAFSILLSEQTPENILVGTAADTMPPLSYFLLHFWMKMGNSIGFLRLLNVLLGLAVLWMAYRWMSSARNSTAGLISALLLAISPFQILHSQEVRMYILLEIGLLGNAWCGYEIAAREKSQRKYWAGFILFGILALYTHNLAIFTLAAVDAYFLLKRKWKKLGQVILAQGVMGIAFLPWLFKVPGQIQKIQSAFWTERPGLVQIIQAMDTLLGSLPQPPWLVAVITILGLQIGVLLVMQIWKHRSNPTVQYLTVLAFLPGLLLLIASYLMRPVFVPRAMITSGAAIYLLIGILASSSRLPAGTAAAADTSANRASGILLVWIWVVSLISLPYQYLYHEFPRSRFAELDQLMEESCGGDPGCLVLHDSKLSYFPAYVYDRTLPQRYLADKPGSSNDTLALASQQAMGQVAYADVESAVIGYRRVYFVTFQKALDEYQALGESEHPAITVFKTQFSQVKMTALGDLRIYEFVR